jgi:2-phospho-L-lactate guanylyltransferase
VRTVLVVTADRTVAATLAASGIEVADDPLVGLNAAYDRGARLLRERDPRTAVGALQADLPALRPAELDAAIAAALATGGRAFTADAEGTGTTFLLAAAGTALEPRFGGGSAERHRASGAVPLAGAWPSLRRDVDTPADLAAAVRLGVGAHTRAALAGV